MTALAHDPHIVILDEPFSGLDPVNAMLLKDVVKEEIRRGKIVLFSSHQMSYIEEFCDSIAIIHNGEVVLSGDLSEIKRGYVRDKLLVSTPDADRMLADYGTAAEQVEHGRILLTLPSADEKKNAMKTLADRYEIDEIRVYEPSLNDIFVEYAGKNGAGGKEDQK